jgi:predicted N-acetyltransferase YhbS
MLILRSESASDIAAREALLDTAFGANRRAKTSERLRERRLAAEGLSFTAEIGGEFAATIRLWDIAAGPGCPALLLGPLAVAAHLRGQGIGCAMMRHALAEAAKLGHKAVLLVGDEPYYGRFGFRADVTERLWLPGPFERARLLGLEIEPGALQSARGMVSATGRFAPVPALGDLVRQVEMLAA